MAQHGDVDDVWVFRIDHDARDRLGIFKTHLRERLTGIGGFVDAVAEAGALAVVGLARTDPNDVWIGRSDGDIADGVSAVRVEDRLKGRAVIGRLPNAVGREGHVDDVRVLVYGGDIIDTATHARWSDAAEDEAFERRIG